MINSVLKADDLSKRYEVGVLALDRLNLDVRPGEVDCLPVLLLVGLLVRIVVLGIKLTLW
jgi:hypothetical protein